MSVDTVLGKKVEYPSRYSPEILVAVPRSENREKSGIDNQYFVGFDVWHGYEISCLTNNGLPVVGILKMVVPADSEYLVESKSLKLYLNSFNMERLGDTPEMALQEMKQRIIKDLGEKLKCEINIKIFTLTENIQTFDITRHFEILEEQPFAKNIVIDSYTENPEILTVDAHTSMLNVCTHLLRSNCKITHQPDWGSVFIHMIGRKIPTGESLLRYIVSLRTENHFHEEICEQIYHRLWSRFTPEELLVFCIYTRRGGIDICPVRASHNAILPSFLSNVNLLTVKLLRQ